MATVEQLRSKRSEFNSKIYKLQQALMGMEDIDILLPKESQVNKTRKSISKLMRLLQEAKTSTEKEITKKNRKKYYHLKTTKERGHF